MTSPAKKDLDVQIAIINNTLTWHARIGWFIAGFFAVVFGGFATWYLPKELDHQKTEIVNTIRIDLNNLAKLQLDKVSAQIESARESGVHIEPKTVRELGHDALKLTRSTSPEVSSQAWKTVNQIAGYSSFNSQVDPSFVAWMNKNAFRLGGAKPSDPCLTADPGNQLHPSTMIIGAIFHDCTFRLDDKMARTVALNIVLFRNVNVIYDGGDVQMARVAFDNCNFSIADTPTGKKLGEMLLASNDLRNINLP